MIVIGDSVGGDKRQNRHHPQFSDDNEKCVVAMIHCRPTVKSLALPKLHSCPHTDQWLCTQPTLPAKEHTQCNV